MLEEAAILLEQMDKVFAPVRIKPAGEDQMVGPLDGVDRVQLNEPHLLDHLLRGAAARRAPGIREHPLGAYEQPPHGRS